MGITEKIYNILKQRLEEGCYKPGSKFPSESMLADEFAVNKMTMNKIVSRLAGEDYLIRGVRGAGTKVNNRIQQKVKGSIAFIGILQPYRVRILNGCISECARNNYNLIIDTPRIEDLQHRLQVLKNSGIKGIISVGYGIFDLPENMKHICVDHVPAPSEKNPDRGFINSDSYQGGSLMMQEVLRRGHREILVFCTEQFSQNPHATGKPRVTAFHHVMESAGITDFKKRTFYGAHFSMADARHFLKTYLNRYPETTLIVTDSDNSAELLHKAARELKIKCPGDIALTGFGDITLLPIATVHQNPEWQGEMAVRHLISMIEHPDQQYQIDEYMETDLVNVEEIPIRLD